MPSQIRCNQANVILVVQVTTTITIHGMELTGGLVGFRHLLINLMETQFVAATLLTLIVALNVRQIQTTSSFNSPFKTLRLGQPRLEHLCQF